MTKAELRAAMRGARGWNQRGREIVRTFKCRSFADAIRFVGRVARLADRAWHHPDIDIRYKTVTLRLTTHDAGGLTPLDFDLARQINRLIRK